MSEMQKISATQKDQQSMTENISYFKKTLMLHHPQYYLKTVQNEQPNNVIPRRILTDNLYNKATAFTENERKTLNLVGLLPPVVETLEVQVKRAHKQLFRFTVPMSQHIYLTSLRERNITLFYRLITDYMEEVLPLIYTPTVGQACLEYGLQFRQSEGMYISLMEQGCIREVLNNWKSNILNEVSMIVVTDGSRILGLGDLGSCGMGIPIGKLALYVAAAGFHPSTTLPILLDVGTDNKELREDEFYLGLRHPRIADTQYYEFIEEFMIAIRDKWPHAVLQFEDFSNKHCFELLEKYRYNYLCFNDDIQGTGAVIAAGFLNAIKLAKIKPSECRVLFLGAGAAGIGVADQIIRAIISKYHTKDSDDYDVNVLTKTYRNQFYMVDSQGLISTDRVDYATLQSYKKRYARSNMSAYSPSSQLLTFFALVQIIKPHALIGLSGQGNQFTREIINYMASIFETPIIFPLSNPTSKAECTFEEAFTYTDGKVIFASGSPFSNIEKDGKTYQPSQGNNLYAFPGLGFGAWLARATKITDRMITEVSTKLADCVSDEDLQTKRILYPPLKTVRETSVQIAATVMEVAYLEGVSQLTRQPPNYVQYVRENSYQPYYIQDSISETTAYFPHNKENQKL